MKWVLGLVTLALAALALEDKGRQVAGDAREAYGEAADQARVATKTLSRNVDQQPCRRSWSRAYLATSWPGCCQAGNSQHSLSPRRGRRFDLENPCRARHRRSSQRQRPRLQAAARRRRCRSRCSRRREVGRRGTARAPCPGPKSSARSGATFGPTICRIGKPPRDPGRRQAQQGVRQGQGDHVRDEQAPGPASHVTAPYRSCSSNACPAVVLIGIARPRIHPR